MGDTAQLWERQPSESPKAFQAAALYFEMGADRSLAAVGQSLGKSKALMERWSSAYGWVERAAAYDAHLAQLAEQARAAIVAAHAARWEERRRQLREDGWIAAEKLYARALEML